MSSSVSREREFAQLRCELRGEPYQELLTAAQGEVPALQQCHTWDQVADFIVAAGTDNPDRDGLLRLAVATYQCHSDHRWLTVALMAFWPAMESIHRRKRKWDRDPDQRWQNTVWSFIQTVSTVDVACHGERIFEKLYAETSRRLYRDYERQWLHQRREAATVPADLPDLAGAAEPDDSAAEALHEAQRQRARALRAHLAAGRITEADYQLLVETRVHGKSVADYCRKTGLSYAATRKRRARVEAAIRDREKKTQ